MHLLKGKQVDLDSMIRKRELNDQMESKSPIVTKNGW